MARAITEHDVRALQAPTALDELISAYCLLMDLQGRVKEARRHAAKARAELAQLRDEHVA